MATVALVDKTLSADAQNCPAGGKQEENDRTKADDTIPSEAITNLARTMGFEEECVKEIDNIVQAEQINKQRNGMAKKNFQSFYSNVQTNMEERGCGAKLLEFKKSIENMYDIQCSYNKTAKFYTVSNVTSNSINLEIAGPTDNLIKLVADAAKRQDKLTDDRIQFYTFLYEKVDFNVDKMAYIQEKIKWPGEGSLQSIIYLIEKLNVASFDTIRLNIKSTTLLSSVESGGVTVDSSITNNAVAERDRIIEKTMTEETGLTTFSDNIKRIRDEKIEANNTTFKQAVVDTVSNSSVSNSADNTINLKLTRPITMRILDLSIDSQSGVMASQLSTVATSAAFDVVSKMRDTEEYKEAVFKQGESIAQIVYENKKSSIDAAAGNATLKGTNSNAVIVIIAIVIILVIALGVGGYFYAKSRGWIK